ncbi:MAG: chromosome segregation protein SMC [Bradymonadales bacterium]|nr:chromosome segregation protein SMC [Bradymonadales bacterium]
MKLRTIELSGFKSFRSRTSVEIGEGITAIVGPNGCGKSNIVDAIRWGLGTQAVRSLRGGEMTDVIFAGSRQFHRAGLAEVSLTFEKTEEPAARPTDLPLPPLRALVAASDRLTVTRRIFRAGDNHYLLNNTAVRLKDIQEIFLGTGAGVKGYSIIEQGQIEFLIGSRPSERRRFVEELAGVSRYRYNREETDRKLLATQQNLDRIADLASEVTRQIAGLKKQCRVAERHATLARQKRQLAIGLLLRQRGEAISQQQALASQLEQMQARRREDTATLALCQAEEGQLTSAVSGCEQAVAKLTEDLFRHKTKGSLLRQAVEHASSECGTLSAERRRLEEDIRELAEETERQKRQLEQLHITLDNQPSLDPQEQEELEGRITEASLVIASTERLLERCQAQLRKAAAELAEEKALLSNRNDEMARLTAQRTGRAQREQQLRQAMEQASKEQQSLQSQHATLTAHRSTLLENQGRAAETVHLVRLRIDKLRGQWEELKQERTRCEAQRQVKAEAALREMSEGARRVIAQSQDGRLDGVVAILGEGIIVETGWESAAHGALRDLLQAVVVVDSKTARQVIRFAREQGVAVTCIQQDAQADLPSESRDTLLAHVELADWVPATIRALLASTRTLQPAVDCGLPNQDGCWVDIEGNHRSGEGIWRSGDPGGGALARRARWVRELAELDRLLEMNSQRSEEMEQAVMTAREEYEEAVARERACQQEIEGNQKALADCEARLVRRGAEIETHTGQLAELERSFAAEQERIATLAELCTQGHQRVETAARRLAEQESEQEQLRLRRDALGADLARHHRALADHQALARQLELQRKALSQEGDRLQAQLTRNQERSLRLTARLAEIDQRTEQLGQQRQVNQVQATRASKQVTALEMDLAQATNRLAELRLTLRTKSEAVRAASSVCAELAATMERLQARREQAAEQIERIETELAQHHGLDPPEAEALASECSLPEDPPAQMARLDEAIESLGPVNQMAVAELAEVEQRHRFLVEQQADLNRAIEDLRATIDELDRTSRTEFLSTFEALRVRFEQLFLRLFQGGEATLALTPSEDPLEAGVEVFVRPPGKRVRCMSLLSGGEKALSAVALVFAAFQLKPSPFCVLDEVDAPLDDMNVERFLDLLDELSAQTQFLVITHNRRTMEAADALVGVTMQEPGCSKLVGVNIPCRREKRTQKVDSASNGRLQLTG